MPGTISGAEVLWETFWLVPVEPPEARVGCGTMPAVGAAAAGAAPKPAIGTLRPGLPDWTAFRKLAAWLAVPKVPNGVEKVSVCITHLRCAAAHLAFTTCHVAALCPGWRPGPGWS